ncbi:hypothetical protein BLA29_006944 [Euroglyphus maynei]|uniref:Uncharacterized protein n=1 Tax=Euroglyphus maynei TaxID=6958 RepID=A0A1Y3ANZ8_EURMA|nr:hypothetical protein BLA29_006944 [Euroglyphus maynei]
MEGGLNIIKQPQARAVFRSSLPATPIATPIFRESFPFFTEQTLMERLCRTPSPRRSYSRNSSQMDTSECEQQQQQHQPMEIFSPTTIDEESLSISSNSASSPNKERPGDEKQQNSTDIQSSLNDIYYKISDQFNPD